MNRDGFVFYRGFYNCLKWLSLEERDSLCMAIIAYGLDWIEPELDGYLLSMFELTRPQIDANNRRYFNWKKWWAPEWNQNARKNWNAIENWEKQSKQPVVDLETTKNNQKQPKEKDKEKEKEKDKEKEKEKEFERKQDTQITFDANASHWNIEIKDTVGKTNGKTLSDKLKLLGLQDELIELAIVYDWCKKWKKLHKFDDKQLWIWVNKLKKCWFDTIEWMKQVLENSIAWWYQWIFELKQKPQIQQKPIASWSVIKVGDANIFI